MLIYESLDICTGKQDKNFFFLNKLEMIGDLLFYLLLEICIYKLWSFANSFRVHIYVYLKFLYLVLTSVCKAWQNEIIVRKICLFVF